MSLVRPFLDALGVTFKNLTRKPTTVLYPFVARERSERYRQTFALVHDEHGDEACIGCKKCERICPSEIITVVPGKKHESPATGQKRGWCDDFTLDLTACIVCELCVQVCPVDAIVMCRAATQPGFEREDLFLTMERLYANEHALPRAPATGTSLIQSHDPNPRPPAAEAAGSATPEPDPPPRPEEPRA